MHVPNKNYAFVDGSYNPEMNIYACGGYLVDQHGTKHYIHGFGNDPRYRSMRNVAGEILGAKLAIKKATELGMPILNLYYDYEGIEKWVTGEWKTKKKGTREYVNFVKSAEKSGLKIYFHHVKAHSGVEGNEEADHLAKYTVQLQPNSCLHETIAVLCPDFAMAQKIYADFVFFLKCTKGTKIVSYPEALSVITSDGILRYIFVDEQFETVIHMFEQVSDVFMYLDEFLRIEEDFTKWRNE